MPSLGDAAFSADRTAGRCRFRQAPRREPESGPWPPVWSPLQTTMRVPGAFHIPPASRAPRRISPAGWHGSTKSSTTAIGSLPTRRGAHPAIHSPRLRPERQVPQESRGAAIPSGPLHQPWPIGMGTVDIQFEQVEGIQKDLLVISTGMQLVEIRLAVLPSPNRFPIHDVGRLMPSGHRTLGNGRKRN
jgi:hypothetical protein